MPSLSFDSLSPPSYAALEFVLQLLRYFGIAGAAYGLVWGSRKYAGRKIDPRPVRPGQIASEIRYSLGTMAIFTANAALLYASHRSFGWFRIYDHWGDYGTLYGVASFLVLILLHDAYFYWSHRLMHHPRLFRLVHRVHHHSSSPTPFTVYSFHPLEAMLESLFLPFVSLVVPFHIGVVALFLGATIAMNLLGHLGFDFYPAWFWRSRISSFLVATTHHHLHHGNPRYNFGFYFRFWDRICGTEDPRYARYRETRRASSSATSASFPRRVS